MFLGLVPVLSILSASLVAGTKRQDEIKHLPGLSFTPNFKHYSGYLRVSGEHELFYWLVTSQHDSASDPLIFWFNGGPGCSSLFGLLSEHGPYLVTPEGDKLVSNQASWNRRASVVYVESPAFVGYSLPGNSPNASDTSTATENYEAIKQFFLKFPEYRHSQVFITGESYAGIYLPTLAERIVDGQGQFQIDFKGMAIGNGLMNWTLDMDTANRFYYGHGMIDELQWQRVRREQCNGNIDECDLSKKLFFQYGHYHYNPYDLYETCQGGNGQTRQLQRLMATQMMAKTPSGQGDSAKHGEEGEKLAKTKVGQELVCENEHDIDTYLNRKDVRNALHVSDKKGRWVECSGHRHYKIEYKGVEAQVKKVLRAGVPVLLFYGDTDSVCNFMQGAKFAVSLGHPLKESAKPWLFNGQLGGFKTVYEGGLTFITVRGSGHMVPQKKGPEILHVLEAFIQGKQF